MVVLTWAVLTGKPSNCNIVKLLHVLFVIVQYCIAAFLKSEAWSVYLMEIQLKVIFYVQLYLGLLVQRTQRNHGYIHPEGAL